MKTLFVSVLILLSLSVPAFAATSQVNDVVQQCMTTQGFVATSPGVQATGASGTPDYQVLSVATKGAGTPPVWDALYSGAAMSATQFSLDATHKFYVSCICAIDSQASITLQVQLGTAPASFTDNTTTEPTSSVYQTGSKGSFVYLFPPSATTPTCYPAPIVFGISSFPFVYVLAGPTSAQSSIWLVGRGPR